MTIGIILMVVAVVFGVAWGLSLSKTQGERIAVLSAFSSLVVVIILFVLLVMVQQHRELAVAFVVGAFVVPTLVYLVVGRLVRGKDGARGDTGGGHAGDVAPAADAAARPAQVSSAAGAQQAPDASRADRPGPSTPDEGAGSTAPVPVARQDADAAGMRHKAEGASTSSGGDMPTTRMQVSSSGQSGESTPAGETSSVEPQGAGQPAGGAAGSLSQPDGVSQAVPGQGDDTRQAVDGDTASGTTAPHVAPDAVAPTTTSTPRSVAERAATERIAAQRLEAARRAQAEREAAAAERAAGQRKDAEDKMAEQAEAQRMAALRQAEQARLAAERKMAAERAAAGQAPHGAVEGVAAAATGQPGTAAAAAFDPERYFMRATLLRDRGLFGAAATLYEECASLTTDDETFRRATIEQIACYVKGGMGDRARELAEDLKKDSTTLTMGERIKVDAVLKLAEQ